MKMILSPEVSDLKIMLMLQGLTDNGSNEIRAQELSMGGDSFTAPGTLLHACAIAGRVDLAKQLIIYGANVDCVNFEGQRPVDLALLHNQKEMSEYLSPQETQASIDLTPAYASDERRLIWSQRKRRQNTLRHLEQAHIPDVEMQAAVQALDDHDREEWYQLEGTYLSQGLAIEKIIAMKKHRFRF